MNQWQNFTKLLKDLINREGIDNLMHIPDYILSDCITNIMIAISCMMDAGINHAKPEMTATEAIYGFMAWLTTRTETIKIGSSENCANVCDLMRKWIETNNLPDPRNCIYPKNITHPEPLHYCPGSPNDPDTNAK